MKDVFRTFTDEDEAAVFMRQTNKNRKMAGNHDIVVLVHGPEENEFTVMELREATDAGFAFRWEV